MRRNNYILNGNTVETNNNTINKNKSNIATKDNKKLEVLNIYWKQYKIGLRENVIPLLIQYGAKIEKIIKKNGQLNGTAYFWNEELLDVLCHKYDIKLLLHTLNDANFWNNLIRKKYFFGFVYFIDHYIDYIDWSHVTKRTRQHPFISFFKKHGMYKCALQCALQSALQCAL